MKTFKILDFTRLLPGPMATKLLVEMGCEVIKIEHPTRIDYTKSVLGNDAYHIVNDGKTIVSLDYESPSDTLHNLIVSADVLIEQFRPGAMKSWGLDYESVLKINPNIIYASLTGYGQQGANSNDAGHDLNYLAQSGILNLHRDENGTPILPGVQWADIVGGGYATALNIMSALAHKVAKPNTTPQYIDLSITHEMTRIAKVATLFNQIPNTPIQNLLSGDMINYAIYKTKDQKFVAFAGLEAKFWEAFCKAVEREDWAKMKIYHLHKSIFPLEEIKNLFSSKTAEEWETLSKKYDLCISKID